MVYNYCFSQFQADKSEFPKFEFEVAGSIVDFKNMKETKGSEVNEIRRVDDSHIRLRGENSDRNNQSEPA